MCPLGMTMNDNRRFWGRFALAAVGLILGAVAVVAVTIVWLTGRPLNQVQPVAQPVAAVGHSMSDSEMMAMLVDALACRQAAQALMEPGDKLRASWAKHRHAHHDMREGRITEAQMKAIWRQTLSAWETEDPAFGQARDALVEACKE